MTPSLMFQLSTWLHFEKVLALVKFKLNFHIKFALCVSSKNFMEEEIKKIKNQLTLLNKLSRLPHI